MIVLVDLGIGLPAVGFSALDEAGSPLLDFTCLGRTMYFMADVGTKLRSWKLVSGFG